MKKEIRNCFTWLVNKVSETTLYNWSPEFCKEENEKAFNNFYEELKKYIDFNNITIEEAKELRFQRWDDEYPDLWLFPLYLVPIIPEGLEVMGIGGNKYKYGKEKADNDIRFGCVAYGINIKEDEKKETNSGKFCSICHKEYTEYGNNAQPINDGWCCDECNKNIVIPARIQMNMNQKKIKERLLQ